MLSFTECVLNCGEPCANISNDNWSCVQGCQIGCYNATGNGGVQGVPDNVIYGLKQTKPEKVNKKFIYKTIPSKEGYSPKESISRKTLRYLIALLVVILIAMIIRERIGVKKYY